MSDWVVEIVFYVVIAVLAVLNLYALFSPSNVRWLPKSMMDDDDYELEMYDDVEL